jgi:hypothetical protein
MGTGIWGKRVTGPVLIVDNKDPEPSAPEGVQWKCPDCGCTILQGSIAGARVLKGEIDLKALGVHVSDEIRCAGCKKLAAMRVDGSWKTLT